MPEDQSGGFAHEGDVFMSHYRISRACLRLSAGAALGACIMGATAVAAAPDMTTSYRPIAPTMSGQTITLTGKDLTADQVVQIARYGAKVQYSADAKQRAADAYGLLLQSALENVPVYAFNRGAGTSRAVTLEGDPLSPENKQKLLDRETQAFRRGPAAAYGPEVSDEEIVRALLAVRANAITYEAASPQLLQMLVDLLNNRITPVLQSRGSAGESDIQVMGNIAGTMIGAGEAYYNGVRMPASEALQKAGLKPIEPGVADNSALTSTNAYATGQAALLVADARQALDWTDLIYAMDMLGMNSNITPITKPVQVNRPYKWLNFDASRLLSMLKGSYLLEPDAGRVIQDAESMRAASVRQGAAWDAWARLRDSVAIQMNSSDHNPAVVPGMGPKDSWELAAPELQTYYVKGGKYSKKGGYVVTNANWDPYPMTNDIEAFTIALANVGVVVTQRVYRFSNPDVTNLKASDVLKGDQARGLAPQGGGFTLVGIWQEMADLVNPIAPSGVAVLGTLDDLQGQTRVKLVKARQAVDVMMDILGQDLLTAAYWMDLRKAQNPARNFGEAPTAAWTAFRKIVPFQADQRPLQPIGRIAYKFLKDNQASSFFPAGQIEMADKPAEKAKR